MHIRSSSTASFFQSRLEPRLQGPSLRLAYAQGRKTSSAASNLGSFADDMAAGVQQASRTSRGKARGDSLSWCVRDWASVAARKGISTAASALCQALVELDKILATVESGSVKYSDGQFHALVCLFDVVARGVLLCLEDTALSAGGRYGRSLDALRGHLGRAKEVASRLCAKRRFIGLPSRKKHLERDLTAVSDAVYGFAASHKPELATTESHYVSRVANLADDMQNSLGMLRSFCLGNLTRRYSLIIVSTNPGTIPCLDRLDDKFRQTWVHGSSDGV